MKVENVKNIKGRLWYIKGVNINYSFENLEHCARELGADVGNGDVLIADNINGDKRKIFKKTKNGYLILYMGLHNKNQFPEIIKHQGKINGPKKKLLEYFTI